MAGWLDDGYDRLREARYDGWTLRFRPGGYRLEDESGRDDLAERWQQQLDVDRRTGWTEDVA